MDKNIEKINQTSVPKAVAKFAVPALISMMVIVIYNVADTFFIGQTGNEYQVAAVSLTTPVFLLFMAIGMMVGVGGTSVISRSLGEGNGNYAKEVSAFCFYISIMIGCVLIGLFWICMPYILQCLGISPETEEYAHDFLKVLAIGAPFIIVSQALSNIIRSEGRAKDAMFGVILSAVVNIILDPILIFGLNLGVIGAATATVFGSICAVAFYIYYFSKEKTILSISPRLFKFDKKIISAVFSIGTPVFFMELLMSISSIILNNFLAYYGDAELAAMNVAMKASMVIILLQMGLGQGIQPLLGYHYGSKNFERFKEVVRFTIYCTVFLGSILSAICWIYADLIVKKFIDNSTVVEYGTIMVKALLVSGPIVGILFIFTNALQAMGKAKPSFILSLSRQGIIFIPLLFILNVLLGFSGIIYAQPITDFLSLLIAFALYYREAKGFPSVTQVLI